MNGILFLLIATGQKHLREARLCIRSIRALSDGLPVTLLTDRAVDVPATVERVEQPSFSWDESTWERAPTSGSVSLSSSR